MRGIFLSYLFIFTQFVFEVSKNATEDSNVESKLTSHNYSDFHSEFNYYCFYLRLTSHMPNIKCSFIELALKHATNNKIFIHLSRLKVLLTVHVDLLWVFYLLASFIVLQNTSNKKLISIN